MSGRGGIDRKWAFFLLCLGNHAGETENTSTNVWCKSGCLDVHKLWGRELTSSSSELGPQMRSFSGHLSSRCL